MSTEDVAAAAKVFTGHDIYRPGDQQVVANTLSRAPLSQTATEWKPDEMVFQLQSIRELEYIPISDQHTMYQRCAEGWTSRYGTDSVAEGYYTRVAVGKLTGSRGDAQLLEFPRYGDISGWHCVQRRAGGHSIEDEA